MNNIFDAVFAQASVLHIPKKDVLHVLHKMKDQLNPGGLMYLAVKEKKEHQPEEEIKKESGYGYVYERFFSYFSMSELKDYIAKLGMVLMWDKSSQIDNTTWFQVIVKKT